MNDQNYRDIISHEWMEKGETAFTTAEVLFREKLLVGCVNRLYFAAFYAVSAALAKEGKEYGKHSAVRIALHRDYVKPGAITHDCGKTFDKLFEDRQEGDYTPRTSFQEEDVRKLLVETRAFLDCFKVIVG
ncbi:MAG: HEPN domain-containing protein [Chitinivibrionales bacterium]|nr:HEPN domain-containing protein [Chitinivibrionales bacterium]